MLSPISPAAPQTRGRLNSLSSAYISRKASGVSNYDDISAYARIKGIDDSRFKAITDTFRDSRLKLRRLRTIPEIIKHQISQEETGSNSDRDPDEATSDIGESDPSRQPLSRDHRRVKHPSKGETRGKTANRILNHALMKATGDIVILGGYRGSILKQAQPPHQQLWVPMKSVLKNKKVDLEVGLTREDEEMMEQNIIATGIISHIGPIDICRRLLKQMRKCTNARESRLRVHDWGWDWRLSPDLLSEKLIIFLESLECNHAETPVEQRGAVVIAHSLGGLITRHAVNQRPELFAGVIYAGVPQHCINILGPLRNGDDMLYNSKILTAQVNFSIRTSFALLPEDGRCFIKKHTNKRYDLDFFDPEVWEEYRLSPCIKPPLQPRTKRTEAKRQGDSTSSTSSTSNRGSSSGRQHSFQASVQSSQFVDRHVLEGYGDQRMAEVVAGANAAVEGFAQERVEPRMKPSRHRPRIATMSTIHTDLAKEYLQRTLAEVSSFKQQLTFNPRHQESNVYPPHAIIFSKTLPTVLGVRVANMEAIKYNDAFDDLAFAAGDGVVLASAAQLPEGYRCVKQGHVESDRGHIGLMGDLEGMGRCLDAVITGRANGVGLGTRCTTPPPRTSSSGDS